VLDIFYERLAASGYRREMESVYDESRLNRSSAAAFKVNDSFPKIVETSFVNPPDHRISNIRYIVELSGLKQLTIDDITDHLKSLAAK